MASSADEWLRQADYDLETAEFMLGGGRRFYAVFMAHLAVEKALKGVYQTVRQCGVTTDTDDRSGGCPMGKEQALTAIERFRDDLIRRGVEPLKIVLYGSYATGLTHQWSDIDLIVVSAMFSGQGLLQRIDLMVPSILASHAPIEPVAVSPEEWNAGTRMIRQIAREAGEVVYSADAN